MIYNVSISLELKITSDGANSEMCNEPICIIVTGEYDNNEISHDLFN